MSFQANKIRQLWFPFTILAFIVLTVGWILAGVVYPNNVQGGDLGSGAQNTPTLTTVPTVVPPSAPPAVATETQSVVLPTETPSGNCTYSMFFWSTNSDAWRIENIVLGNLSYTKVEAIEILQKAEPSPTERLLGQFFSTLLNTLHGADSAEIDSTMVKVRDWLIINPHGIGLSESELLEIETYTAQLEDLNRGVTGPGACLDEPVTPTPVATQTPTAAETSTPGTLISFFTPTATKGNGGRSKPANPPPPAQPTNTSQPQPTNTTFPTPTSVIPPTNAPTLPPPANTQPPPPTNTLPPLSPNTGAPPPAP